MTWLALAPKPLSSELLRSAGASIVHHRSTTNVAGSSSLNSFTRKISVSRLTIFSFSKRGEYAEEFHRAFADSSHLSERGRLAVLEPQHLFQCTFVRNLLHKSGEMNG